MFMEIALIFNYSKVCQLQDMKMRNDVEKFFILRNLHTLEVNDANFWNILMKLSVLNWKMEQKVIEFCVIYGKRDKIDWEGRERAERAKKIR